MPTMRIFIAVDISNDARDGAAQHISKMGVAVKDVRVSWERFEKLHVTLKFLGNVDKKRIEPVTRAIASVAESSSSFELSVTGTGVFPSARQPRVLWLGIVDDGVLTQVASQLDAELLHVGFEPEGRRFSPHLTIARIREPQKAKRLAEMHLQSRFETKPFTVNELIVYKSELKPTGSVYSVISTHPLGAAV